VNNAALGDTALQELRLTHPWTRHVQGDFIVQLRTKSPIAWMVNFARFFSKRPMDFQLHSGSDHFTAHPDITAQMVL
jgi:hypothetical protein